MPLELKIPPVGESITQVQIVEWQKAEGEGVQKDEPVAVIDSEKTTFELPAPASGTLVRILHQVGEMVEVGSVIAHIEAGSPASPPKPSRPAEGKDDPSKSAAAGPTKSKMGKDHPPGHAFQAEEKNDERGDRESG